MYDSKHTISESSVSSAETAQHSWRFLSNHMQVLLCIYDSPEITQREIANRVGITERAAQRIVTDLADGGYITRERTGRRNRYLVDKAKLMRHPAQFGFEVGDLLELLGIRHDDRSESR
jgi:DNA-binding MarR family transcriptional regulator